jgi:hypothetical protein
MMKAKAREGDGEKVMGPNSGFWSGGMKSRGQNVNCGLTDVQSSSNTGEKRSEPTNDSTASFSQNMIRSGSVSG